MKQICFSGVLLVIMSILYSCGGTYYMSEGMVEFKSMRYNNAIALFEKSLAKKDNSMVRNRLADAYRLVNNTVKAEEQYAKVMEVQKEETMPENYLNYSRMLMENEKYTQAAIWLNRYLKKYPGDPTATLLMESSLLEGGEKQDSLLFKVEELEIEKGKSAFCPVPFKDGIVFSCERPVTKGVKQNPWTGNSYLDLYFTKQDSAGKWSTPSMLKGNINGDYHEAVPAFTKDGKTIYFTRSNYLTKKLKKDGEDVSHLKIFKAQLKDTIWTDLKEVPFNSETFSVGHPSLSADNKIMFFISDRPGGFGGTDIYYSTWNGTDWNLPKNAGAEINTKGNEMFPCLTAKNDLYFSSDGHVNLGGLDIFVSHFYSEYFTAPINLGFPLNSSKDDFGFYMNPDEKTGYLSSARSEKDLIYTFKKIEPEYVLKGTVTNKVTGEPIENAQIQLYLNKNEKNKVTLSTDKDGKYKTTIKKDTKYDLYSMKDGYFRSSSASVSSEGEKYSKIYTQDFVLDPIIMNKPIVLNNIYYDLAKWDIKPASKKSLNSLVKLLKDNPSICIELSSHTDSRASDKYNLTLSDKRAKSAVDYIKENGIEAARLTSKGYGESALLNRCKNDIKCTEEEHLINRRTEFKVTKIISTEQVATAIK